MSKHTPGPWHRNIRPATKYTTVWSGRSKHVAHVSTAGMSDDEVEANISLIAAAPELLEALKWVIERNDAGQFIDGECMKSARAAIAKATA